MRTLLSNSTVEARGKMIVLRDMESNLVIAERMVADLDHPTITGSIRTALLMANGFQRYANGYFYSLSGLSSHWRRTVDLHFGGDT